MIEIYAVDEDGNETLTDVMDETHLEEVGFEICEEIDFTSIFVQ